MSIEIEDLSPRQRFALLKSLGGSARARKSLGARLAAGEVTAVFKRAANPEPTSPSVSEGEPKTMTTVEKNLAVAGWRTEVREASEQMAKRERIPYQVAEDRVMSARTRLEKLDKIAKLGGGRLPQHGADVGNINAGNLNTGAGWPIGSYSAWLESLVADAINRNPSLSKSQGYDAILRDPAVRKKYDAEKAARLAAATRVYG